VHQVEIITGTERRRRWSEDEKRVLVSAGYGLGESRAIDVHRHCSRVLSKIYATTTWPRVVATAGDLHFAGAE
jgi:hypothetical protein